MESQYQQQQHPYVPRDLILPDFVDNSLSGTTINLLYLSFCFLIVFPVWILSGRCSKLTKSDRRLMCWWALCAATHIIIEGYYVLSPEFYKDKTSFFFAEIWKEYSRADSRYASRASEVMAMELSFVFLLGPAMLLAIYAIVARKSYRYALQIAIAVVHIYGASTYMIGPYLEGNGSHYASAPYFHYASNIGPNCIWVATSLAVFIHCWNKISAAFQVLDHKKTN